MKRREFLKLAGGTLIASPFMSVVNATGREAIAPMSLSDSLESVGRVRLLMEYDLLWDTYVHRIDVLVNDDLCGVDFKIFPEQYKEQLEESKDYYQSPLIELARYLKDKGVSSLSDCGFLPHHGYNTFVGYIDNELARYL